MPRGKAGRPSLGPVGNIQPTLMWLNRHLVRELGLEPGVYYEILVLENNPRHPLTYILAPSNPEDGALLKGNDKEGYRLSGCYSAMQHIKQSVAKIAPPGVRPKLRVLASSYKPSRGVAVMVAPQFELK